MILQLLLTPSNILLTWVVLSPLEDSKTLLRSWKFPTFLKLKFLYLNV